MKVLTLSSISRDMIIEDREIPLLYIVKDNCQSGNTINCDIWFRQTDNDEEDIKYNFDMIDDFINMVEKEATEYKAIIFEKKLFNEDKLRMKFPKTHSYLSDSLEQLKYRLSLIDEINPEMSVIDYVITFF